MPAQPEDTPKLPQTPFHFGGFSSPNYTQVPDEFFDAVLPHLGEAELRVLLYIFRRTFGFKKDRDAISLGQFLNGVKTKTGDWLDHGCGLKTRSHLIAALASLQAKGLISAYRTSFPNQDPQKKGYYGPTVYTLHFKEGYQLEVGGVVPERDYPLVPERDYPSARKRLGVVPERDYPSARKRLGVVPERDLQETVLQETVLQETVWENSTLIPPDSTHNTALWESILQELQRQLSKQTYDRWFRHLSLDRSARQEAALMISVPTIGQRDFLTKRFGVLVNRIARSLTPQSLTVSFVVSPKEVV